MTTSNRESTRIRDLERKRVMDVATRKRRARKAIESLENDNFHEDPHADLVINKKLPKFQDTLNEPKKPKKRYRTNDYYKSKYRKNFQQLVEEDRMLYPDGPNYTTAAIEAPTTPARKFCAVCGFFSTYTCVQCGTEYCSVKCLGTHLDTRCLKWIV